MKRIKNFFKNNVKVLVAFVVGILISCVSVYAATVIGAGEVSYTNNSQSSVQSALDDLYEKAAAASSGGGYSPAECVAPTLNVGDYVTLVPDSTSYKITTALTGYTSDQTINPSELTLWRVIKKNPCNVEVVSEYVSSTAVYFRGTTGYANFVGGLNEIARQYGNKYVSSARHMGYDGQTEYITDTSAFNGSSTSAPPTTTTSSPTSGTGSETNGGVTGDTLYLRDYLLVNNVYGSLVAYDVSATTTARAYWIASRRYYYGSSANFGFSGRNINASGSLHDISIRYYSSDWSDRSINNRVRPILTLKSGLTVASGSGTKASPYVFN